MSRRAASLKDPRTLFGRRLRTLRKLQKWSQERLALESGLARSYLGGVERGERNISLLNICALAATLQVPPHELLHFGAGEQAQRAP